MVSPIAEKQSKLFVIDKKFMDSFGYEFDKNKEWAAEYTFIHNFEDIGWPYPIFQSEKWLQEEKDLYEKPVHTVLNRNGKEENVVYPKEKFNKNFSPLCSYLPTNKLLIQLMRTAIFIEDENELLFNYNNMVPDFSSFGDETTGDQKSNE